MMILQDDILYDDITWWYFMMIVYDDDMSWGHGDGYVVLRASMNRPMIKAVCGETMVHSTETVWEMLAQEEWLGCHHNTSPMVDILGSILVWASYMIFYGFLYIQSICIMF